MFLLMSCAAKYKQPEVSTSSITFKAAKELASNSHQSFGVYSDPICSDDQGYGVVGVIGTDIGFTRGNIDVKVIESKTVYIVAGITTVSNYSKYSCKNLISFTPEPNSNYIVQQKCGCRGVAVINTATKTTPKDLTLMVMPNSCKYNK